MPEKYLQGLSYDQLQAWVADQGEPTFRAGQIWQWLYRQRVIEASAMTNLPQSLRDRLADAYTLQAMTERTRDLDADGAGKLLLTLTDGETVETAVIPSGIRRTVCVSSQIGCRFGCVFCASGQAGFRRNLDAGEMIGQILAASRVWNAPPTHLVFMGIGEPLDNPEALEHTLQIANDRRGLAIGARRMTVSTCGLVPGIERLATFPLQIELSVSLHAPDNELRSRLMPVNRKYPIESLLTACAFFALKTKRLITFEYTLVSGVNDSEDQAHRLVQRLRGLPARVNLIPLSPVCEFEGQRSSAMAQRRFMHVLQQAGINVTVRVSRGTGVSAACGQLRTTYGDRGQHVTPTR